MCMLNRVGKFAISLSLIRQAPEAILKVMEKVIVMRAEHMWYGDKIEYLAISNEFREVEPGVIAPTYEVICTKDENGEIKITFKEVNCL